MLGGGWGEGEVGEDVAVVDEEGASFAELGGKEVGDIGDAAGGFEEDRFIAEGEGAGAVAGTGEAVLVGFRAVMGIDDELVDPDAAEVVEGVGDERAVENRD